jgi:hypothetical protein
MGLVYLFSVRAKRQSARSAGGKPHGFALDWRRRRAVAAVPLKPASATKWRRISRIMVTGSTRTGHTKVHALHAVQDHNVSAEIAS